jgi:hypothetical protein
VLERWEATAPAFAGLTPKIFRYAHYSNTPLLHCSTGE